MASHDAEDASPEAVTRGDSTAEAATKDSKKGALPANWRAILKRQSPARRNIGNETSGSSTPDDEQAPHKRPEKWNMGILNDSQTDQVPGSVLLLSKTSQYNEPLGLRNMPFRTSASSLPSQGRTNSRRTSTSRTRSILPEKKRTADGKFVLEPQPDDSLNDPLNWRIWRRDAALFSLGFYCMLGGGMTTVIAAGFNEVAADFHTTEARVALTTGLYMMGLGIGSVILSPTAILFGKRIVYLIAAICFVLTSVWCALSPSFASLVVARIFMGFAVSSVECLPSATVAEIYFLHEKAYRLGIYTLLLLGGKNLVPLVSAAIVQSLGWRWVFWVVAIVVGFGLCLLFLFVPETFWDRTPQPHNKPVRPPHRRQNSQGLFGSVTSPTGGPPPKPLQDSEGKNDDGRQQIKDAGNKLGTKHAHFGGEESLDQEKRMDKSDKQDEIQLDQEKVDEFGDEKRVQDVAGSTPLGQSQIESIDYFRVHDLTIRAKESFTQQAISPGAPSPSLSALEQQSQTIKQSSTNPYTRHYQHQPPKNVLEQLKPWSGRLSRDNWFRVAVRPFILYAYPSILWSALVYSLSIGWLIVLSESVAHIYENKSSYNFSPLQTGLVYISPFVGGVLGTAVAGKVSDIVVRYLARRNGGVYEPEFRLIMGIPITITTVIGLMGYGWSAAERDLWIVPTVFFGLISFGCALGSTTAITFAVDSYRQYAGEALVTLNFSKNIFHGLVFSLFFNNWLNDDGSKTTFIAIGGMQLGFMMTTIPMYMYGKRARMWTVRKNLMESF